MQILAISGSLRSQSTSTTLLRAIIELAPSTFQVELYEELHQIPPFNPDLEADNEAGPVFRFRKALRDADVVFFSTPEYAHGMPGALKNALDWIVGSGELSGKPVVLVNASSRGIYAQASLKETLKTMDAKLHDHAEVTVDLLGKNATPADIAQDPVVASTLANFFEVVRECFN